MGYIDGWMDERMDRIRSWRDEWMNRCMTVRLDKFIFIQVVVYMEL